MLFVCTGNLCRSPYAAAYFASRATQAGLVVQARSAGLYATPGVPSPPALVGIGKEEGLDLSSHVATCVTQALVEEADLILTMEHSHLQEIHHLFPGEKEKMLLLSEFASERNRGRDIADPYGLSPAHYRSSCEEIRECVEGFIHFLRRFP